MSQRHNCIMLSINYSISPPFNKGHGYFTLKPKYFPTRTGFFGIFTRFSCKKSLLLSWNLVVKSFFQSFCVLCRCLTRLFTYNLEPFGLLDVQHGMLTNLFTYNLEPFGLLDPWAHAQICRRDDVSCHRASRRAHQDLIIPLLCFLLFPSSIMLSSQ